MKRLYCDLGLDESTCKVNIDNDNYKVICIKDPDDPSYIYYSRSYYCCSNCYAELLEKIAEQHARIENSSTRSEGVWVTEI